MDTKVKYNKSFTGSLNDSNGNVRHFINGAYGRENDLPAIEYIDGSRLWYKENPKRNAGFGARQEILHRMGGPAVIYANGDTYWMQDGELHRDDDLPAIIKFDVKKWFIRGKFIRLEFTTCAKP